MRADRDAAHKVAALTVVVTAITLAGCKREPAAPAVWKSGTTVIPAAFSWDAESDAVADGADGDLRWEHVGPTERYLVPVNGTEAAVVKYRGYEQVDGTFLERWHMPKDRMPAGDAEGVLAPGAVVAFRTAQGALGKLKIVGFSSPDAQGGDEPAGATRAEHCHLEIAWTLFQSQQP